MDFLDIHSGSIQVVFSFVVAISTVVYAVLTAKLVTETRRMRKAQTEPAMSVIVRPSDVWINLIELNVKNIGVGPAYDIRFEPSSDFEIRDGEHLSDVNFIKNGIRYLGPQQQLSTYLTNMTQDYQDKIATSWEITTTYQSSTKKRYEETFTVDLSQFVGMRQIGRPPLTKMAESLDKIQRDFHPLTIGHRHLKFRLDESELEPHRNRPRRHPWGYSDRHLRKRRNHKRR